MANHRTKITYWSRIINQFVPSVMSELVWILIAVANAIVKFIINACFYFHISCITLLKRKGSIHMQIAHLPMFSIWHQEKCWHRNKRAKKDNFIKKESINTLLPEQSKNLGEENTIIQNSNKVNKANNTNNINKLATQVKNRKV